MCDLGTPSRGVLEGRAPCAACGTVTCAACASPCRGCLLLARLRAICAGAADAGARHADEGDAKTFHIVRTMGRARDVLLTSEHVAVRVLGDPRYHSYFPRAAPHVLTQILRDTGVRRLERPLVARAAAGPTWRLIPKGSAEEIAWLIPVERGVEVRFRPPLEGAPRDAIEVPPDGPWALPAPWSAPPPAPEVYVDGLGVACAHCATASPRYRAIDRYFICRSCGRSFTSALLERRERTPQ